MYPPELTSLIDDQYGLVADHQLRDRLPDVLERRDLIRSLGLRRITTRVLGLPVHGAGPGPGRALTLRVLDGGRGAVLWSKTSTTWWGFGRFRLAPVHVARRKVASRPPIGASLHQLTHLDRRDVTTHQGVPIVRPEGAILWLAGMWTHRLAGGAEAAALRLEKVVDHAWREGLVDGPYLHELADRSGGKGRSGIVALRSVLETRPPDHVPPGSGAEARFEEILPFETRRLLRRQVRIEDHHSLIGVVDYQCTRWPLIVEVNGEQWHTTPTDRLTDDRRYERLLKAGFSVVVLWQFDVWHEVALVREVISHLVRTPDPVPTLHRPTPAPWAL